MKLRAVVFGALVIAATVGGPAAAEEGIHVSPGALDAHGCYAIDVWNGDVLVRTIPASYDDFLDRPLAPRSGRTAFLPSGILLFDVRRLPRGRALDTTCGPATARPTGPSGSARTGVTAAWGVARSSDGRPTSPMLATSKRRQYPDRRHARHPGIDLDPSGSPPGHMAAYVVRHGRIFYSATDTTKGRELWVSSGTVAGTHVVKDIRPGARGSYPRQLSSDGSRLRFTADDGTGRRWWVSDGTRDGTHPK